MVALKNPQLRAKVPDKGADLLRVRDNTLFVQIFFSDKIKKDGLAKTNRASTFFKILLYTYIKNGHYVIG